MLRLDDEPDSGALLIVNIDIDKRRNANDMDSLFSQITFGDHNGLDGLIDSAGTDGLHFGVRRLAHDTGNGAGDSRCPGTSRYLNDIQGLWPITIGATKHFFGCDAFYHGCLFSNVQYKLTDIRIIE